VLNNFTLTVSLLYIIVLLLRMNGKVLIVDDNQSVLTALEMLLQSEFDEVYTLKNPANLITSIQQNQVDVILLDMNFKAGINTGNEGIHWLRRIYETDSTISVVLITAYGDVELAVKAVKEGAFDFILKPWDNTKLISTLNAALKLRTSKLENKGLREKTKSLTQEIRPPEQIIIGQSASMKEVFDLIKKVAITDANVLLTGENGTGKEVIAQEIHRISVRSHEIMVGLDMGAISETLFDSELFGHMKGSFTDAKEDRAGKFETAHKGTLFLDEIGNLTVGLQAKILAALQNRVVTRIGSNTPIPIDIRLISATNRDLPKMIADGLFREDLLYRINTITIEIPPLRERGSDVLLLAGFYLNKYGTKYDKPGLTIGKKAEQRLMNYPWPGNVRELQHCIERAVILADKAEIDENNLALNSHVQQTGSFSNQTFEEMEKQMIIASIEKENRNMSAVAKSLGITRPTLYKKMKRYDIK
jgi:DNA-binding NtrC family response regulator